MHRKTAYSIVAQVAVAAEAVCGQKIIPSIRKVLATRGRDGSTGAKAPGGQEVGGHLD